jgi:dienelactone hydrolase
VRRVEILVPSSFPQSESRRHLLGMFAGSALLAVAGCTSRPPGGDEDAGFKQFSRRGYEASVSSIAEPYRDIWLRGEDEIAVSLLVPRSSAPSPLVVYLPGMGESVEAGELWRRAWAQAGYAVASLQTGKDAALWSSATGRGGDFTRVAREQFDAKMLAARLHCVDFVLKNIVRRAAAQEGVFGRIDTGRVAVAGFDLGAQTALALAGEKHPGMGPLAALPSLRAVIAMSPHARVSGGFAARFGGIALPVLSITGTEDADPYGLVDSPHTRQAPFKFMPPGGKYMLVLEDGTHQLLAGALRPMNAEQEMPDSRRGGGMPGGGDRMGGPGGGMGKPGGMRGGGPSGAPPGMGGPRRAGGGAQRQTVIVERVSLAFLDAFVKQDPVAAEWLARDAARWIDRTATLAAK